MWRNLACSHSNEEELSTTAAAAAQLGTAADLCNAHVILWSLALQAHAVA